MRRNKKELVLTSLLTISPIAIGLFLYQQLPEKIAVHFNYQNVADTYYDRNVAILFLPAVLLIVHLVIYTLTYLSLNVKPIHPKLLRVVVWIIPVISFGGSIILYAYTLKLIPNVSTFILGFVALIFIVIGNYLPKCEHNYFIGVKTPWALASEENWKVTHRFAGPLWVVCGLVMLVVSVLQLPFFINLVMLGLMVILPYVYSYRYHNRKK